MFVSSNSPLQLPVAFGQRYELHNEGPETLYYGEEPVSENKKIGEVAKGATITLENPWAVIAGGTLGTNLNLTFVESVTPERTVLTLAGKTSAEIDALIFGLGDVRLGLAVFSDEEHIVYRRGITKWFKSAAMTEIA